MLRIGILTIFPSFFECYLTESIMKKAVKANKVMFEIKNLRDFATDKHKSVDDRPFGGGPGMIIRSDIVFKGIDYFTKKWTTIDSVHVFLVSPGGKLLTQPFVEAYSKRYYDSNHGIIIIAPRYEGIDDRVREVVDYEISVGPYVLTGGELPALVIIDSIVRQIPGVLGNEQSVKDETMFSIKEGDIYINAEFPQYTRPRIVRFRGVTLNVPKVLLGGDHSKIRLWRDANRKLEKIRLLEEADVVLSG